ncbi:hypothetical protein B0H17DRAFT_1083374 [Mycena rosella]|uniref:Uncharacterized protein n=1 Tax=Mycena rosella TaxID=1033263 RepID=A0AAD7G6S6_MYCRO|nr:hypothetical protein B0H17DRAFT_1083374 [Mycena rosella]
MAKTRRCGFAFALSSVPSFLSHLLPVARPLSVSTRRVSSGPLRSIRLPLARVHIGAR